MTPRPSPGFTLVELAIVVVIIGLLATLAISSFLAAQLRARRAEVPISVDAIRTAESAYHAEWDTFTIFAAWHPPLESIGRTPQALPESSRSAFQALGWLPDGLIYGSYNVAHPVAAGHPPVDLRRDGPRPDPPDGQRRLLTPAAPRSRPRWRPLRRGRRRGHLRQPEPGGQLSQDQQQNQPQPRIKARDHALRSVTEYSHAYSSPDASHQIQLCGYS